MFDTLEKFNSGNVKSKLGEQFYMKNTKEITQTNSKAGEKLTELRKSIAKADSESRNNLAFDFGINNTKNDQPLGWSQWSQFDNFNQWSNHGW